MDTIAISGLEPNTTGRGPINITAPIPPFCLGTCGDERRIISIPKMNNPAPISLLMSF